MAKKRAKRGRTVRNQKQLANKNEPEELVRAPHSFVIHRGKLGKNANELLLNFRRIMEPYTATQLKVQKHNVVKDFVTMAGPLNVSHLIVFTKSQVGMYLKLGKLPRGPTLSFQIKDYTLARDVLSNQKKTLIYESLFMTHPLLVLNNFSGDGMQFKLMITMFQNMFPSINVNSASLNAIRRSLVFNYNSDDTIDVRHYAIKVFPTGMSKAVKKLIQSKVPDLGHYQEIGEYLYKSGNLSESEAELDTAANTVTLAQPISSRGNISSQKSAIRLFEIGPRLTLQLVKIEEDMLEGEVLYHKFISKTPEEVKALKARIKAKKALKEQRRQIQKQNVERKKAAAVATKPEKEEDVEESEDDDRMWFRKEVGEEPDEDFAPASKRRKVTAPPVSPKKMKTPTNKGKKSKEEMAQAMKDFLALQKKRKNAKAKKKLKKSKGKKRSMKKK